MGQNVAHIQCQVKTIQKRFRKTTDESYVIDLCDELLGITASRQHRFEFLKGDAGTKLPVDAYYKPLNLVIEYREKQHSEQVKISPVISFEGSLGKCGVIQFKPFNLSSNNLAFTDNERSTSASSINFLFSLNLIWYFIVVKTNIAKIIYTRYFLLKYFKT